MSNVIDANESILIGIRPMCNVDENDDGFDKQLIPLINGFMMIAHHDLGIGFNGFNITGAEETWAEWLGSAAPKLAAAKTWLGYKTFLVFDPPENGSVIQAYEKMIDEAAWTLCSKSRLEGHAATLYPVEFVDEDD